MLPRLVNDSNILRGKIFHVALSFTKGRPLNFVVEEESNPGLFKTVKLDDGFEGKINPETGELESEVVKIVTEFKLRPAVIIQKDEFNKNPNYPFIVVLPIATFTEKHKEKSIYRRVISHNDVDSFYYLGRDTYITVNDPHRIYKNMLFEMENVSKLSDEVMEKIMKRFAKCFEIRKIVECQECAQNCEKCEYKLAVNK
jgi:mRNA-degrading endonuclease toxin of MazEF toxin-antitoxin module